MKKLLGFMATAIAIALAEYFTDIKLIPLVLSGIWHGLSWCWNTLVSSYALPGWVLLILATINIFLIRCGFILLKSKSKKQKEIKLRNIIENAYQKFIRVVEPDILDPENPGNPYYMKVDARDYINPRRSILIKAGLNPPPICTIEQESLDEWYFYLQDERLSDRWADFNAT